LGTKDQARELLQLIGEGFVLVDADFRLVEMNAEAERIEGRRAQDLIGTTLWQSWPDLQGGVLERAWRDAIRDDRPVALEHCYSWPDGRQAWLEMRAYPRDGGLAIFYRDITDRKRSESELKRAQAELLQASRMSAMGTMAATLAHELSQPLTSATNYLDASLALLREVPKEQARVVHRTLLNAATSVEHASEILRRLRSFVSRGRTEADIFDLHAIINDASVLVLPLAHREGVEVEFDCDPVARWVEVDAIQIQQVLVNLLRNAIEAMHDCPMKRIDLVTASRRDDMIEITVCDTGHGFGETPPEHLFVPFHTSKEEGLGVGLSISRTIVEAHGGKIWAEPRAEGGAQFHFTLPISADALRDEFGYR